MREGNLLERLRRHAAERPGGVACELAGDSGESQQSLTWAALWRRSDALAAALRQACPGGERALLLFNNDLEFVTAFLACLSCGVVAVPLYPPRLNKHARRVIGVAEDCAPAVVLTVEKYRRHTQEHLAQITYAIPVIYADTAPAIPGAAGVADTPGDIAFLQYTSGSTSAPKGVVVSHDNLMDNLRCLYERMGCDAGSHMVSWLPLYHDMGLIMGLLLPLYGGFPVTLLRPAAFLSQPSLWLRTIGSRRATMTTAPDFAYQLCADRVTPQECATLDLSSLKTAVNAAEPIRLETLNNFAGRFAGCGFSADAFRPGFGMAEATLAVTLQPPGSPFVVEWVSPAALENHRAEPVPQDGKAVIGCGSAVAGHQVYIAGADGRLCAEGEVGEVWVAGPGVAQGYWRQPQLSQQTFCPAAWDDGEALRRCLRTGDLGYLRAGQLFITGRLKDLLIVRGLNYYPQDIEYCVQSCWEGFAGCRGAAFQTEDDGMLVVVQEVARSWRKKLDIDSLAHQVVQAVAQECGLTLHAFVVVAPSGIPLTSSGKIQRRLTCRQWLAGELPVAGEWRAPAAADRDAAPGDATVAGRIRSAIAACFSVAPAQVRDDLPLTSLGFSSLHAVTLAQSLSQCFGVTIDTAYFYDYPTPAALTEAVQRLMGAAGPARQDGEKTLAAAIALVASLSDEEVQDRIDGYANV